MFLVYCLLTPFYLELYNFSVQNFSSFTFGSASPQQVCFSLGSYTSCIALPHLRSLKTTTTFSLTEPTANGYLVPGPGGLRDLPVPARTPRAHPTSRTPGTIQDCSLGAAVPWEASRKIFFSLKYGDIFLTYGMTS